MTLEADLCRIEEALAAGPTLGPWIADPANPNMVARDGTVYEYVCEVDPSVFAKTDHDDAQCNKDASYIAACHPDAILRLVTIAKLYDQILGALRLAAVLVPHGIDRKIIAAAIDAIVSAKGQKEREPVGKAPVLSNGCVLPDTKHLRRRIEHALIPLCNEIAVLRGPVKAEVDPRRPHPIETAPDKEDVLLFGSLSGRWFIGAWCDYLRINQPRITHWAPLPSRPGEKEQQPVNGPGTAVDSRSAARISSSDSNSQPSGIVSSGVSPPSRATLSNESTRRTEHKPVVWRLRIGDSDVFGYCDAESDADSFGKQSGRPYVKEPLYASPPEPEKPAARRLTDEEFDDLVIDEKGLPRSHLEYGRVIESALAALWGVKLP